MPIDPKILKSRDQQNFVVGRLAELKLEYPMLPSSDAWEVVRFEILAEKIAERVREDFQTSKSGRKLAVSPVDLLVALDRASLRLPELLKHAVLVMDSGPKSWPDLTTGPLVLIDGYQAPQTRREPEETKKSVGQGIYSIRASDLLRIGRLRMVYDIHPDLDLRDLFGEIVKYAVAPELERDIFKGGTLFSERGGKSISVQEIVLRLAEFNAPEFLAQFIDIARSGQKLEPRISQIVNQTGMLPEGVEGPLKQERLRQFSDELRSRPPLQFILMPANTLVNRILYDPAEIFRRAKNEHQLGSLEVERRMAVASFYRSIHGGPYFGSKRFNEETVRDSVEQHLKMLRSELAQQMLPGAKDVTQERIERTQYEIRVTALRRGWLAEYLSR